MNEELKAIAEEVDDLLSTKSNEEVARALFGSRDAEKLVGLLRYRSMGLMRINELQEELQEILSDACTDHPLRKLSKTAIISHKIGDITGE